MIIGSHVKMSSPNYVLGSVQEALSYDANALMLYSGAPQNTKRVDIEKLKILDAKSLMDENHISIENLIVHAPYLINLANSVKLEVMDISKKMLVNEVYRTSQIGAKYLVLHPGSYTTTDLNTGIHAFEEHFNEIKNELESSVCICLETMAGKGTEIGKTFEELAILLEKSKYDNMGICLDTCHIHDAGYDLNDFDSVLDEFDRVIGLKYLHVIHLNDSKNERGCHLDRHANIGVGKIGLENLLSIAYNKRLENIPKILETPYIDGKPPYKEEIKLIRDSKKE